MQGERPSEKPKGAFKNDLKVVMKWIQLVDKQRKKNKKVEFYDFLDFLQVKYEPQELSIVNQFIKKNFDTEFNEDVLLGLMAPEDDAKTKQRKNIKQSFLLLTGGNMQMETTKLLDIIKSNSPIPAMNQHIVLAIQKIESNGFININSLVEYLI